MIDSISCIGYRGFSTEQFLSLAKPNGKEGSGLTVLIGPNGGGKSTLVECLSKLTAQEVSFTEGKRNKLAGDKVKIRVSNDKGEELILSTVDGGGSETSRIGSIYPKIYYLPSRRVFNPYFGKSPWSRELFIQNPINSQFRGTILNNFTYRLFDAMKKADEFNKLFWRILGNKLEWTIDQNDEGQYYVKVKKNGNLYHSSDGLGEGIVSLLFITDAIFEANEDELIVIDEPELSLHPQLQMRLLKELLNLTRKIQVVISTHSANMISIDSIINGGMVARVYEKNGGGSRISCIDEQCRTYFKSFEHNIYNPHIMGSDARACFFAEDGLIITEGQEDVVLYPYIIEHLGFTNNISFFGFGAGGANNITYIAYILKTLGFIHVGAIFDGDKKKEYNDFKEKYRDYKAWIIPADDIRDKPKQNKESKDGLLDKNNVLKDEYVNKMSNIFCDILEFEKASNLDDNKE